jgi:hypothetical protein
MILIYICCFVIFFNKNVFLSTTLDFPVILDGQYSSVIMRPHPLIYRSVDKGLCCCLSIERSFNWATHTYIENF